MVKRATAKVGDHVFVTGTLGDSALGLKMRGETPAAAPFTVSDAHRSYLVGRYLRPRPPLALVPVLRDFASASMDISDGLVKDLARMAEASGAGALIDSKLFPLSAAARAVVTVMASEMATIATGGDDYQVLATVAPQNVAGFIAAAGDAGVAVAGIGRIIEGHGVVVLGLDGKPISFDRAGYDHF